MEAHMIAVQKPELSKHEPFNFHSLDELRQRIRELGLELEVSDDTRVLLEPLKAGQFTLPNRLVVLPMEGCDGKADGSPDALTFRRYQRFAAGGAGLLWVEATAVVPEGRANPRQLWINENNVKDFAAMVSMIHRVASESMGSNFKPILVLQLTHSGRYSKPVDKAQPIIAQR